MEGEEPEDGQSCAEGHLDPVELAYHEAYLSWEYFCLACGEGWLEAYY